MCVLTFRHLMLSTGRCKVPRGIRGMTYVFHYGPFQPFLQNLWLHSLLESRIRPSWNWFISAPKLFIKYNWPSKLSEKGRGEKGSRHHSPQKWVVSERTRGRPKSLEKEKREQDKIGSGYSNPVLCTTTLTNAVKYTATIHCCNVALWTERPQ